MQKQQLVNAIQAWMQRFANRDNDAFYYDVDKWHLILQYHFDLDGEQYEPYAWLAKGSKLGNALDSIEEKELQEILTALLKIKKHH
jgi:2'-5' RNA ligase